jgi:hypothetical protein
MKKEAAPKCKGLKRKTSNEKKAPPKCKGLGTETNCMKAISKTEKSGTISSPKPASLN